jgi:hypothetical protein
LTIAFDDVRLARELLTFKEGAPQALAWFEQQICRNVHDTWPLSLRG